MQVVKLDPAIQEMIEHLKKHEGKPGFSRELELTISTALYWAYNYGVSNGRYLVVEGGEAE